ncbi:MAG: heme-binding protein [Pseudomonadota bacterium]
MLPSLILTAALALVQDPVPRITDASAQAIVDGCRAYAEENDLTVAISVVDDRVRLVAFRRMDGTREGPAGFAMDKAEYSATWGSATKGLSDAVSEGRLGFALATNGPPVEGGVPIYTDDGTLIGGVGVSGAPAVEDARCARAGIERAGLEDSRS